MFRLCLLPWLLLTIGLVACSAPQRVEFHLVGGGVSFAEGQEVSRADALAIAESINHTTSTVTYQQEVLQIFKSHLERWRASQSRSWGKLELGWHEDVIGADEGDRAYAEHSALSVPADWLGVELPSTTGRTLAGRIETTTQVSPDDDRHSLALLPQAAILIWGKQVVPREPIREALKMVRQTQVSLLREVCAARGLRLYGDPETRAASASSR